MDQNWSFMNFQSFADAINNLADAVREQAALNCGMKYLKDWNDERDCRELIVGYIKERLTNAKKTG